MTVLNIEYLNEFEALPMTIQIAIVLSFLSLAAFIVVGSILICSNNNKYIPPVIISFSILLLITAFLGEKNYQKSEYIKYKEVLINDDYKWDTETIQNWEIDSKRGDIYVLKPKDGQMIQEDQ